ncbi:NAD(P)/FAD-dependent oxidoreductase [Sphingopyxis sp. LARHCG72]
MSENIVMGPIIVIGGGEAGGRAAVHLRDCGYTGELLLVCGEKLPPYERPSLSKELLLTPSPAPPFHMSVDEYESRRIELVHSPAEAIDRAAREVGLASGRVLGYDKLLLCPGAEPRRLGIVGEERPGIFHLREADQALRLRNALAEASRVLVVGGGFIGLEVAASARQLGREVTIIERDARLMARSVPAFVSESFARIHGEQGIDIRFGIYPVAFEGADAVESVRLSNGLIEHADLVVVGIGAVPRTELARSAGLDVTDGIVVDRAGRTSDPHIYAAGDAVCQHNDWAGRPVRLECWQSARDQAEQAAQALLGSAGPMRRAPWIWSDQFDHNLQIAGFPRRHDAFVARGNMKSESYSLFQLDEGRLTAAISVNRPADMSAARKLMAAGTLVDAEMLKDETRRLKSLLG